VVQAFNTLTYGYATQRKRTMRPRPRKELLDTRPDASTVLALLAAQHEARQRWHSPRGIVIHESQQVLSKGMVVGVFVRKIPI